MAHGSPRLDICHDCKQYTLVPRFSEDPKCPNCGQKAKQTNKDDIIRKYKLSLFGFIFPNFGQWIKIK